MNSKILSELFTINMELLKNANKYKEFCSRKAKEGN